MTQFGIIASILLLALVPCLALFILWVKVGTAPKADLAILSLSCVLAPLLVFAMVWYMGLKASSPHLAGFLPALTICAMVSHGLATLKKGHFRAVCILGLCITIPCCLIGTSIALAMAH